MLRLVLREERHELRGEYFARLAILCVSAAIFLMVIWALILLSLYVQVRIDKSIASDELSSVQDPELMSYKEEAHRLSGIINEKIGYLSPEIFNSSVFVDLVIDNQGPGIDLSRIEVVFSDELNDKKRKVGEFATITLNGIASTRSDLINFQKSLNNLEILEKVETPYSSFASNVNISFDMTIKSVELMKYYADINNEEKK